MPTSQPGNRMNQVNENGSAIVSSIFRTRSPSIAGIYGMKISKWDAGAGSAFGYSCTSPDAFIAMLQT